MFKTGEIMRMEARKTLIETTNGKIICASKDANQLLVLLDGAKPKGNNAEWQVEYNEAFDELEQYGLLELQNNEDIQITVVQNPYEQGLFVGRGDNASDITEYGGGMIECIKAILCNSADIVGIVDGSELMNYIDLASFDLLRNKPTIRGYENPHDRCIRLRSYLWAEPKRLELNKENKQTEN